MVVNLKARLPEYGVLGKALCIWVKISLRESRADNSDWPIRRPVKIAVVAHCSNSPNNFSADHKNS